MNVNDWNALVHEHCQYGDIPEGMYYATRKFVTEQQNGRSHAETLIKLSEMGQAMLDQIRLEVCIEEENATNMGLSF